MDILLFLMNSFPIFFFYLSILKFFTRFHAKHWKTFGALRHFKFRSAPFERSCEDFIWCWWRKQGRNYHIFDPVGDQRIGTLVKIYTRVCKKCSSLWFWRTWTIVLEQMLFFKVWEENYNMEIFSMIQFSVLWKQMKNLQTSREGIFLDSRMVPLPPTFFRCFQMARSICRHLQSI